MPEIMNAFRAGIRRIFAGEIPAVWGRYQRDVVSFGHIAGTLSGSDLTGIAKKFGSRYRSSREVVESWMADTLGVVAAYHLMDTRTIHERRIRRPAARRWARVWVDRYTRQPVQIVVDSGNPKRDRRTLYRPTKTQRRKLNDILIATANAIREDQLDAWSANEWRHQIGGIAYALTTGEPADRREMAGSVLWWIGHDIAYGPDGVELANRITQPDGFGECRRVLTDRILSREAEERKYAERTKRRNHDHSAAESKIIRREGPGDERWRIEERCECGASRIVMRPNDRFGAMQKTTAYDWES